MKATVSATPAIAPASRPERRTSVPFQPHQHLGHHARLQPPVRDAPLHGQALRDRWRHAWRRPARRRRRPRRPAGRQTGAAPSDDRAGPSVHRRGSSWAGRRMRGPRPRAALARRTAPRAACPRCPPDRAAPAAPAPGRARRPARAPAMSKGSSTFSTTLSGASRLCALEHIADLPGAQGGARSPSAGQVIRPAVGASSPPMSCSSVDLPLPDGPTMAMRSPAQTVAETPSKRRDSRRAAPVACGRAARRQRRRQASPTTRPSARWITRCAARATASLWVTSSAAPPLRQNWAMSLSTCCSVSASTCPVGSSASSSCGLAASATARATRAVSPPESCAGQALRRSPRPTSSSRLPIRRRSTLRR